MSAHNVNVCDITDDVKEVLKKFRFQKHTSNSALILKVFWLYISLFSFIIIPVQIVKKVCISVHVPITLIMMGGFLKYIK